MFLSMIENARRLFGRKALVYGIQTTSLLLRYLIFSPMNKVALSTALTLCGLAVFNWALAY